MFKCVFKHSDIQSILKKNLRQLKQSHFIKLSEKIKIIHDAKPNILYVIREGESVDLTWRFTDERMAVD